MLKKNSGVNEACAVNKLSLPEVEGREEKIEPERLGILLREFSKESDLDNAREFVMLLEGQLMGATKEERCEYLCTRVFSGPEEVRELQQALESRGNKIGEEMEDARKALVELQHNVEQYERDHYSGIAFSAPGYVEDKSVLKTQPRLTSLTAQTVANNRMLGALRSATLYRFSE